MQSKLIKSLHQKKPVKVAIIALLILSLIFLINFVPTFSLKTSGMKELKGKYITVYYETYESAAKDTFELVNSESERISNALGFQSPQHMNMYIYDYQNKFQTKKYGYIALLLNLDWYVGDNRGTNLLLTSPANSGKVHDYNETKYASIHEMVHAYNSILNKKMPLWLNEGLAGYLTDQMPSNKFYKSNSSIPTIKQMHTSNPVKFEKMLGYEFSFTYIEYLEKTYGFDNVVVLAKTNNYEKAFGKSETDIFNEWIVFLKKNYS